ncbi:MAG: TatD family hydrolase [Desulfatiglandales bacterium]
MELEISDAHAHLNEISDLDCQIIEAKKKNVHYIVGVGMEIESNEKILKIANSHENVLPAIGYHPWVISYEKVHENLNYLRQNALKVCAIGEVGLDYKVKTPKELQKKVFEEILQIASEYKKPLIIHARYSHKTCLKMVKDSGITAAIFHWYSGPKDLLDEIIMCNYYISVTPALAYSPPHREAASYAPLEHILLETDAPVEYRGKESRIVDVWESLKFLSEIKGLPLEEVARVTSLNFKKVFGILEEKI